MPGMPEGHRVVPAVAGLAGNALDAPGAVQPNHNGLRIERFGGGRLNLAFGGQQVIGLGAERCVESECIGIDGDTVRRSAGIKTQVEHAPKERAGRSRHLLVDDGRGGLGDVGSRDDHSHFPRGCRPAVPLPRLVAVPYRVGRRVSMSVRNLE